MNLTGMLQAESSRRDLVRRFQRESDRRRYAFKESDHPRDGDGKFTDGGGSSGRKQPTLKVKTTSVVISRETASKLFGRVVDSEQVAGMFGAPDGSEIRIHPDVGSLHVNINGDGFEAKRMLTKDSWGNLICENQHFEVKQQGGGLGAKMFSDQVNEMSRAGVKRIVTQAARWNAQREDYFVGYKVWPKMGYDGSINPRIDDKLPKKMRTQLWKIAKAAGRHVPRLSMLLAMPGGQEWWDKNGDDIELEFDLTKGSQSRKILAAYLKKKRAKSRTAVERNAMPRGSDKPTSDEDDVILNELWAEIRTAGGVNQWAEQQSDEENE